MKQTRTIIAVNNEAIVFLNKGCRDEALENFKLALNLLRKANYYLVEQQQKADNHINIACGIDRRNKIIGIEYQYLELSMENSLLTSYKRFFKLSTEDEYDKKFVASVILYNAGLADHIYSRLTSGLRFYQASIEILQLSGNDWTVWMYGPSLLLALLNNMGQIHSQLFHSEETRSCFSRLSQLLHRPYSSTISISDNPIVVDLEDHNFFMFNAMLCCQLHGAIVPPAA